MYNIKVSLTIELPGGTILSKQECLKQLRKPVTNITGKQVIKKGIPQFTTETVEDWSKCDKHILKVYNKVKKETEYKPYYTRKSIPARQHMDISQEAYESMVSDSYPEGYKAPFGFKPDKELSKKGYGLTQQAWMKLSEDEKLMWHFQRIAADLGGEVADYSVLDD